MRNRHHELPSSPWLGLYDTQAKAIGRSKTNYLNFCSRVMWQEVDVRIRDSLSSLYFFSSVQ